MRRASLLLLVVVGCSSTEPSPAMRREALLDPETCKECHEDHYREWSASMHAYAATDPVFLAMNARGQRETDGELGDFCVSCHAPMAVREGATEDGLNLDDVPGHLKGVTCYFCHNVERVEGTHNNPLVPANDTTMRGNVPDPVKNPVHESAYSRLVAANAPESSELCGPCHDIMVPRKFSGADTDVHLERTFLEFKESFFGREGVETCARCHMARVNDVPIANFEGVGNRSRHLHGFPAVDVAITPFPPDDPAAEAEHTAAVRREIDQSLIRTTLCVSLEGMIRVELDNFQAGHNVPSGASQDRRLWVEVRAFDANDQEIYSSGVLPDPLQPVVTLDDPDLWLMRDKTFDKDGNDAHMFWKVASIEEHTIPSVEFVGTWKPDGTPNDRPREIVRRSYHPGGPPPARVAVRVRLRPMGLDVLRDLVESGDLEERFLEAMPIHDVLPNREDQDVTVEWRSDRFEECVTSGRDQR
jgi:hypothetical protein